jgi:uncharacterized protein
MPTYAGRKLSANAVVIENGVRDADDVLKEINAHGVSVVRIVKGADGSWAIVRIRATAASPPARRWRSAARCAARSIS